MSSAIVLDAGQAQTLRRKLDSAMFKVDAAQRALLGLGALLETTLPGSPGDGLKVILEMLADDLDDAESRLDAVFEGVGGDYAVNGCRIC